LRVNSGCMQGYFDLAVNFGFKPYFHSLICLAFEYKISLHTLNFRLISRYDSNVGISNWKGKKLMSDINHLSMEYEGAKLRSCVGAYPKSKILKSVMSDINGIDESKVEFNGDNSYQIVLENHEFDIESIFSIAMNNICAVNCFLINPVIKYDDNVMKPVSVIRKNNRNKRREKIVNGVKMHNEREVSKRESFVNNTNKKECELSSMQSELEGLLTMKQDLLSESKSLENISEPSYDEMAIYRRSCSIVSEINRYKPDISDDEIERLCNEFKTSGNSVFRGEYMKISYIYALWDWIEVNKEDINKCKRFIESTQRKKEITACGLEINVKTKKLESEILKAQKGLEAITAPSIMDLKMLPEPKPCKRDRDLTPNKVTYSDILKKDLLFIKHKDEFNHEVDDNVDSNEFEHIDEFLHLGYSSELDEYEEAAFEYAKNFVREKKKDDMNKRGNKDGNYYSILYDEAEFLSDLSVIMKSVSEPTKLFHANFKNLNRNHIKEKLKMGEEINHREKHYLRCKPKVQCSIAALRRAMYCARMEINPSTHRKWSDGVNCNLRRCEWHYLLTQVKKYLKPYNRSELDSKATSLESIDEILRLDLK
jgi:hypothetical protein